MKIKVLVADDDLSFRQSLVTRLEEEYEVYQASNAAECLELLDSFPDVILLDVNLPPKAGRPPQKLGIELIGKLMSSRKNVHVIIITGTWEDTETAVEAMRNRAANFLLKRRITEDPNCLLDAVKDAVEPSRLADTLIGDSDTSEPSTLTGIGNWSPGLRKVLRKAELLAKRGCDILILGETGVGKTMIARAIHLASTRANQAFESFDCTQLSTDSNTAYLQLFGGARNYFHPKFPGDKGLFARNNHGTILMDEIGLVRPELQGRLLTVTEAGMVRTIMPLGGPAKTVDVRVLYATDKDLEEEAKLGRIFSALLGRLEKLPTIRVPPLRERREDIENLVNRFVRRINVEMETHVNSISPEALDLLQNAPWPRNIRELYGVLVNAVVEAEQDGEQILRPCRLRSTVQNSSSSITAKARATNPPKEQIFDQKTQAFIQTFIQCKGNVAKVAKTLRCSRDTAHTYLQQSIPSMVSDLSRVDGNLDTMAARYHASPENLRNSLLRSTRFARWFDNRLKVFGNDWVRFAQSLEASEPGLRKAYERITGIPSLEPTIDVPPCPEI